MQWTLITTLAEKLNLSGGNLLMVVAIGFMGYQTFQLEQITKTIVASGYRSTTEYAYHVLQFSYRDVATPGEVITLAKQWRETDAVAQISAIRTLCNEEPNRLTSLMDAESVKSVCRISH